MATFPHDLYTYFYRTETNNPDANGDWRWRINFTLVSQNQSANTSTFRIRHYIQFRNQPSGATNRRWACGNQVNSGAWSLNQEDGMFPVPFDVPAGNSEFLIWTQNRTITHESDGKKTAYLRGRGGYCDIHLGIFYIYMYTTNTLFEFPTIPRYASITKYSLLNNGLSSLKVSWSANSTCDLVQYSVNGGAWTTGQTGDRTSGSFNLTGLTPGVSYSVKIRVRRKDSGLYTESSTKSASTTDIAKITSAPDNIIMGNNITVNYSNPSGSPLSISIYKTDGMTAIAPYRACSGTSYTFTLTEAEKNNMYNSIPTTNDTRFRIYIRTEAGSNYLHYVERKFILTNANPIFSNFAYEDTNTKTTGLTGNNQTIIKGYSNLRATISTSNKAIAQKGATMKNYQLVIGSKQISANYSDIDDVNLSLNSINNNVFSVYAIDSRGNSTLKQISPSTYIDYFEPYIISPIPTATRTNGIDPETTLSFNGKFFNDSFGAVNNSLTITYEYKKTNESTWTSGTTTITPTINGNDFSFTGLIAGDKGALGFDSQYSYDIKIIATDELSSTSYDLILGTGKPDIAIHRDGVAFNAPYDEELGGALQVSGDASVDDDLDVSGNIRFSGSINGITATELGYLDGVTSNIQEQLNGKVRKLLYDGNETLEGGKIYQYNETFLADMYEVRLLSNVNSAHGTVVYVYPSGYQYMMINEYFVWKEVVFRNYSSYMLCNYYNGEWKITQIYGWKL